MTERELTAPVALTLPNGRLNRDAVGWGRSALVDTSALTRHGWGRTKRWEYWCVLTPHHIVAITTSALGYAALQQVWLFDRATATEIDLTAIAPFGGSVDFAADHVRSKTRRITVDIAETEGGTRVRAGTARVGVDLQLDRRERDELLGVVVPFSDRRFQYTIKEIGRPATGIIAVDGTSYRVLPGESWGVRDHGRGRWPYRVAWQWAAGYGEVGGRRIGIQLGGTWTAGTGSTENALFVDGRLHKISEELAWSFDPADYLAPWRIRGERADVTFTPFLDRVARTNLGIIAASTDQCFGSFSGWIADDAGARVSVDGVTGWAENVANRW